MESRGPKKSFWGRLLGRGAAEPAVKEEGAPAAQGKIFVPEEKRKLLEEAIPFHRPPGENSAPAAPLIAPLESAPAAGSDRPKTTAPDPEPYRKKYKKYGRDVCLASDGDPYDVLMDNSDSAHHNVDKVSPL